MAALSLNQKKFLRALGHSIKPIVMIGQHGLSEAVLAEINISISKHELLKISIRTENREHKQKIIKQIIKATNADLVQVIGNMMVIYHPFDKNQKIILPRK